MIKRADIHIGEIMDLAQHVTASALQARVPPPAGLPFSATSAAAQSTPGSAFAAVLQGQLGESADDATIARSEQQDQAAGVARQLESLLVYTLLKEMWATVPEGTLLDTGLAGQFYREMWLEALADEISQTAGGIGLSGVIEAEITQLGV